MLRAGPFSPGGLALRALLLATVFGVCEAAGLREHTTFLSGTPAAGGLGWGGSVVLGVVYLAAWFGFVLLTPILLLAAGLFAGWQAWISRRREGNSSTRHDYEHES